MFRRAILVLSAAALVSIPSFGQGKPGQPGPPSTTPQVVIDSTGKTVGEVIDILPGLKSAHVKYVLPNGDYVVLNVTADTLSAGAAIDPFSMWNVTPETASIFFTDSTCQSEAYLLTSASWSTNSTFLYSALLTPSQGQTILGVHAPQLPPPTPGVGCPVPYGMEAWLYARKTAACPFGTDPSPYGHTVTFQAFYGMPGPTPAAGFCNPIPGGLTLPNATHPYATFANYSPVENLSVKFTGPFSIK